MNKSQEIVKTIKTLAKEQGCTIGGMLETCDISKNALSSMNLGYLPRLENLVKIADYLNVSVDYLLGREVQKNAPDSIRSAVINAVNRLPEEKLDRLLGYLEALAQE